MSNDQDRRDRQSPRPDPVPPPGGTGREARPEDTPTIASPGLSGGGSDAARGAGAGSGSPPSRPDSSAHHGRFLPGTQLGKRYRIVGLLGRGGMGEVYRADDLELGQTVALKLLPAEFSANEQALTLLRNEVRVARQIAHPNVCRVYDIGEHEGHAFVSMEYVDGEDLHGLLRRIGRLPREKGLDIARQLCAGLAAAHENGILHRDLKPANIMLDGRGRVRIMDFGLAGFATEIGEGEPPAGTIAYMAPEQVAGRGLSQRSDIYALGLVLYELFTGRRVFEARSLAEMQSLQRGGPPASLSELVAGVEPAVESAVLRCLELDPERRPSSAHVVAAALPGGDPLAAAIAAGETPSPEMVAAAGGTGGLRPLVGGLLLAGILIGILGVALINDRVALFRIGTPEKPPAVLVDRIHELLHDLDRPAPVDEQWWFTENENFLTHITETDSTPGRWSRLRSERPGGVRFRYRGDDDQMYPLDRSRGRLRYQDPPLTGIGMSRIQLDAAGRLVSFEYVESVRETAPDSVPTTDWTPLFAAAELERDELREAPPLWNPLLCRDERIAWTGPHPDRPGETIQIDAGAYHGRPVYFRVTYPFDWLAQPVEPEAAASGAEEKTPVDAIQSISNLIGLALILFITAGAVWIARRNVRLGRGDRTGAIRLGLAALAVGTLSWVLQAHHAKNVFQELYSLATGLGRTLLTAAWFSVVYLAVEPYVRRFWPDMMISWSRLFAGQWRNPRVGRDVLIGGLLGAVAMVANRATHLAPTWWGLPMGPPDEHALGNLGGVVDALGSICHPGFLQALFVPMIILPALLLIKKRTAALIATATLLAALNFAGIVGDLGDPMVVARFVFNTMFLLLVMGVLVRYGLLAAMAAGFFTERLHALPMTLDTDAWYWGASLVGLLALGACAIYAYRIATRRPVLHQHGAGAPSRAPDWSAPES
jgi:serine/threonine-protein kinase